MESVFAFNLSFWDRCMSISTLKSWMPGLLLSAGFRGFPESCNCQIQDLILDLLAPQRTAWFGSSCCGFLLDRAVD